MTNKHELRAKPMWYDDVDHMDDCLRIPSGLRQQYYENKLALMAHPTFGVTGNTRNAELTDEEIYSRAEHREPPREKSDREEHGTYWGQP